MQGENGQNRFVLDPIRRETAFSEVADPRDRAAACAKICSVAFSGEAIQKFGAEKWT